MSNLKGRNIKLYIRGKEFKQLKSAELSNWTGKAFIGKRHHVKVLDGIEEAHVPGVYFLLNKSQDPMKQLLYIGEADDIAKRINNHRTNKDWWEEFIVFISKDANLNKAHVRYLEKRLYDIALNNYALIDVKNDVTPPGSKLPECDIDEMEEFLDNLLFTSQQLQIFNMSEIEPMINENVETNTSDNIFEIKLKRIRVDKNGNQLKAFMKVLEDGNYLLLKGSYIESVPRESFVKHNYYKLWNELKEKGLLYETEYEGVLVTKEDIPFNSPSAAGAIVKCGAVNGRKQWKNQMGYSLDNIQSN